MKIAMVGAGALGCSIGAALSEGGSEVWLINRSKEHVNAINTSGLRLFTSESERTVKVRAATTCDGIAPVDLVIVLVKSFHTREAMSGVIPIIAENTVVLSLQNGLGNEDILAEVVRRKHVVAGRTYVGGVLLSPGCVISGTRDKRTIIGELDGSLSERVVAIAAEFNQADLHTTISQYIMGTIWDKLLVNVATGAVSGITGLTYGELYQVPELRYTALAVVVEAMDVAKASGVQLSITDPEEPWLVAAQGLPPEFKTSMLQSREKGSMTEIDFINGAVVRQGVQYGVPTPVNAALVACIKGIERRQARAPTPA